jgi:hypothetical protein
MLRPNASESMSRCTSLRRSPHNSPQRSPVTLLVAPQPGCCGRWAWHDLLPLSLMIRGVLSPGPVALADR